MKLLVEQHPEYEIVMVFQNPNVKFTKVVIQHTLITVIKTILNGCTIRILRND